MPIHDPEDGGRTTDLASANEESAEAQWARQHPLTSRNILSKRYSSQTISEESLDAFGMMLYDRKVKREREPRTSPGRVAPNKMRQKSSLEVSSDTRGSDQEDSHPGSQKLELAKQITAQLKVLPLNYIDSQGTTLRSRGMDLVQDLSKAKVPLQVEKELLFTIFASIFALPPIDALKYPNGEKVDADAEVLYNQNVEALEAMLRSLLLERPSSTELLVLLNCVAPWIRSGHGHERERAVNIYVFLIKSAATYPTFHVSQKFPELGLLIGQLCQCLNDPKTEIGYQAMEGLCFLYFLIQQQTDTEKDVDQLKAEQQQMLGEKLDLYDHTRPCQNITKIVKEFGPLLTSRQMTELLLTATNYPWKTRSGSSVASYTISSVILEQYKHKLHKQVPEIVRKIYQQLGFIHRFQNRIIMLKVVTSLAHSYMTEVCGALLQCPFPMDRFAADMWRALTKTGSEFDLMVLVNILLKKLQVNPKMTGNYIAPLAVASAFFTLLSQPKCSDVAFYIYPRLLMTLLVQVHYNIRHKEARNPVSQGETEPVSYLTKALKTLFRAVGCDCKHLFTEKEGLWRLLISCEDHHRGVGMLARVLLQCFSCDRLKILYLLVPFLERGDEEHQITALAIFVELLCMSEAKRLPDIYSLNRLNRGLVNTNPVIRALCISGLVKMADWPGKDIKILLPSMIKSLSGMDGRLYVEAVAEIEKILAGPEGEDYISNIMLSLQELFSDERESVRASAIFLFGKILKLVKKNNKMTIRHQILENLVPLFLHLQEENPDIHENSKYTLDECFRFLGCKLPKEVVFDKTWHENEVILDKTCQYLVQHHEGHLQRFLYQGLFYSESKIPSLRKASVMFLGFLVLHMDYRVGDVDLNVIINSLERLMHDSEEPVCKAAAQAQERVSSVLFKRNMTADGDTAEKVTGNPMHHNSTATRSSSSNFFAVIGLWKSANKT